MSEETSGWMIMSWGAFFNLLYVLTQDMFLISVHIYTHFCLTTAMDLSTDHHTERLVFPNSHGYSSSLPSLKM